MGIISGTMLIALAFILAGLSFVAVCELAAPVCGWDIGCWLATPFLVAGCETTWPFAQWGLRIGAVLLGLIGIWRLFK